MFLWWSQASLGSVALLPIKALLTGAIQGATSLRGLSWRGRLGIVVHNVLYFYLLWALPYLTMRQAKIDALGLGESAPVWMADVALKWLALFTCFQRTIGTFFGGCVHWLSSVGGASPPRAFPSSYHAAFQSLLRTRRPDPGHAPDGREHGIGLTRRGRQLGAVAGGDGGQLRRVFAVLVHLVGRAECPGGAPLHLLAIDPLPPP